MSSLFYSDPDFFFITLVTHYYLLNLYEMQEEYKEASEAGFTHHKRRGGFRASMFLFGELNIFSTPNM